MATIYPTNNYATGGYIYTTTNNSITPYMTDVNTALTYDYNAAYNQAIVTNNTATATAKKLNEIESSFGKGAMSYSSDTIAEALFTLKPKLKKKYKGDKAKFLEDLMWAAQRAKENQAAEKISEYIGDGEDF